MFIWAAICIYIYLIYQYQIIWCRTMKQIHLKMSGKPPLSKGYLCMSQNST